MIKKRSKPHKQKKIYFTSWEDLVKFSKKKKLYQQKNKFDNKKLLGFK